jgi:hypothetical protein
VSPGAAGKSGKCRLVFRAARLSQTVQTPVHRIRIRTPHINDIIADGVRSGLGRFVLSPAAPHVFKAHLQQQHRGDELRPGLAAYLPFDLKTLFRLDQPITNQWKLVSQEFFDQVGVY